MDLEFSTPCLFGLEGLVANELRRLKLDNVRAENGRVRFSGSEGDIARVNIRLRFGERLLIQLGEFPAATFEELFQGVKALPLERFIPRDGAFPVKGHSLDSKLFSIPDCQKIIKKAAAARLGQVYHTDWMPETGSVYQLQFAIMKDTAHIYLDTTGPGLFKRGYRPAHVSAPLRETLAAAIVDLSHYRGKGDFCDPFCGSGTIAIEAALIAKNRAPGLSRSFSAQSWKTLDAGIWRAAREEAIAAEFSGDYRIFASDIDPKAVEMAQKNAQRAGVDDIIEFSVADARQFSRTTDRGILACNPPYGERMLEKAECERLYRDFGKAVLPLDNWQMYILSSHTEFERSFGRTADKKRKLYNGMIKCELYMYNK